MTALSLKLTRLNKHRIRQDLWVVLVLIHKWGEGRGEGLSIMDNNKVTLRDGFKKKSREFSLTGGGGEVPTYFIYDFVKPWEK